jgi:hypothetical protein
MLNPKFIRVSNVGVVQNVAKNVSDMTRHSGALTIDNQFSIYWLFG